MANPEGTGGRRFDREHGVATHGIFFLSELEADRRGEAYKHATHYEAVPVAEFRALLDALPPEKITGSTFVDVGAGMGRAMLLASEYPFKQVCGVELSRALYEVARDNLTRASGLEVRCRDVRIARADARRWRYPKGDLVAFLFNPFDRLALRDTFEHVLATRKPGDAVVAAYHTPVHGDVLLALGASVLETFAFGTIYAFPRTSRSFCE